MKRWGASLSGRRYYDFGSLTVKQDCRLASTGSDWPAPVVLLFSSFVSGSFFLQQLDSTPLQVCVLLPALDLLLVLCSILQKTGAKSPLISKMSIGPPCEPR